MEDDIAPTASGTRGLLFYFSNLEILGALPE